MNNTNTHHTIQHYRGNTRASQWNTKEQRTQGERWINTRNMIPQHNPELLKARETGRQADRRIDRQINKQTDKVQYVAEDINGEEIQKN